MKLETRPKLLCNILCFCTDSEQSTRQNQFIAAIYTWYHQLMLDVWLLKAAIWFKGHILNQLKYVTGLGFIFKENLINVMQLQLS